MRDDINQRNMVWRVKFCWWPERCSISHRRLWLRFAYYGCRTNYYRPIIEYAWHDKVEHLIWMLKK